MAITLKMEERSYGGKKFRPRTEVFYTKESHLLICVTNWGTQKVGEQVTESIQNFMTLASEDQDITVAYSRKDHLHQKGNVLRMSVIMASEKIHSQYNKDEYTCGFEIFAAIQDGPQWIYVSCGQPSLILSRPDTGILPLIHGLDLNVLTAQPSQYDPLPNYLLGLGQQPPIQYGNLTLKPNDKLALICRSRLSKTLFELSHEDFNLVNVSNTLAHESTEMPFWLNLIQVE